MTALYYEKDIDKDLLKKFRFSDISNVPYYHPLFNTVVEFGEQKTTVMRLDILENAKQVVVHFLNTDKKLIFPLDKLEEAFLEVLTYKDGDFYYFKYPWGNEHLKNWDEGVYKPGVAR